MYKLFSRRMKKESDGPKIYEYEVFPAPFRTQFFYLLTDVLDFFEQKKGLGAWEALHDSFCRELGVKRMIQVNYDERGIVEYFVDKASNQDFLDFMDYAISFIYKLKKVPLQYYFEEDKNRVIDNSIQEFNYRLKQHNLGYEFVNGEIIRKDNKYLHQEVVKPALRLLYDANFKGAEQEFLDAFEHRRKGENKDAILDALKAFESTMKAICDSLNYPYDAVKSTAKDLISILEANDFYPAYLNNHMTSLRTSLESGIPTLRNKNAGHGQGAQVVNVSDEYVEYALNLAATNIVFLTKIYLGKKSYRRKNRL